MYVSVRTDARRAAWWHWAALAAVLALGGLLRTFAIDQEALWGDEAQTLVIAHWPVSDMLMRPTDPTPFLYYALHKFLMPADAGAVAVRGISLAAGLLAIPAIYCVGRLAFGRAGGLLSAALLAVWASHVDYSQEARAYSLLVLLTLCSAAGLLWWFRESGRSVQRRLGPFARRHWALAAFALATTAAFYTHLVAVFWIGLAMQILISVTQRRRSRPRFNEALTALAAMAAMAVPGLIRLVREAQQPDSFSWLKQAGPGDFAVTLADLFLPSRLWLNPWVEALGIAPGLRMQAGLAVSAAAALLVMLGWKRRADLRAHFARRPEIAATIAAFLALPFILWLFGYAVLPIFMPRTALFAIPGAILLLVGIIHGSAAGQMRTVLSGTAFAAYLFSTLAFGLVRDKENWRGVAQALAANVRPGDVVMVCANWRYPALRHALSGPLGASALMAYYDGVLLLERNVGSNPDWSRSYYRDVDAGAAVSRKARYALATPAGASMWMVGSECRDSERAAFDAWIGKPVLWRSVWESPFGPNHAGVRISSVRIAQPKTRSVWSAVRRPAARTRGTPHRMSVASDGTGEALPPSVHRVE